MNRYSGKAVKAAVHALVGSDIKGPQKFYRGTIGLKMNEDYEVLNDTLDGKQMAPGAGHVIAVNPEGTFDASTMIFAGNGFSILACSLVGRSTYSAFPLYPISDEGGQDLDIALRLADSVEDEYYTGEVNSLKVTAAGKDRYANLTFSGFIYFKEDASNTPAWSGYTDLDAAPARLSAATLNDGSNDLDGISSIDFTISNGAANLKTVGGRSTTPRVYDIKGTIGVVLNATNSSYWLGKMTTPASVFGLKLTLEDVDGNELLFNLKNVKLTKKGKSFNRADDTLLYTFDFSCVRSTNAMFTIDYTAA